jgi:hypothetical protein
MQDINELIQWRTSETTGNASIGTFKEVFSQFEALLLCKSKNGAERATILMTDPADRTKTFNVVCSIEITPRVRSREITLEHIAQFPVFHGEKGFFVGIPNEGWVAVKKIVAKAYVAKPINFEKLIA